MKQKARIATKVALAANIFLFIIKAIAGFMTNSIALISDAANSFIDIFSSIVIYIAVKVSHKRADDTHPFGHHRAEPIAALVIAILTGILGFELLKESVMRIVFNNIENISYIAIIVLGISIVVKTILYFYFTWISKNINSPAMHAHAIDSRNDVVISGVAIAGIILSEYQLNYFDGIAGVVISIWIFIVGYRLARENLDYLMGKTPSKDFIGKMRKKAQDIKGVTGVNDIRAHYVGNFIHVELHAEVDKKNTSTKAHDISKDVQHTIEKMKDVNKAFIHIDPRSVVKKTRKKQKSKKTKNNK